MGQPTTTQTHFQFQENTSSINAATSLIGTEDTTLSGSPAISLDTTYFLRVQLTNTGNKTTGSDLWTLQYNVDAAGWNSVSAGSSNVVAVNGLGTDGEAVDTGLLTGGIDTNGLYSETGTLTHELPIVGETEHVFSIQFDSDGWWGECSLSYPRCGRTAR